MALFRNVGACPVECLPARAVQWQAGGLVLTRGMNAPRLRGQPAGCTISQCCEIALDLVANCSFLNWKLTLVPID
jgi:hypothetical protein